MEESNPVPSEGREQRAEGRDESREHREQSAKGRLQRPADFTGPRLTTFREIFLRHGLPGLSLGILLLLVIPDGQDLLERSVVGLQQEFGRYLLIALVIGAVFYVYSGLKHRAFDLRQLGWVIYLGCLSVWEEWLFRVIGPYWLNQLGLEMLGAILLSNVLFGVMHYFTLRWRWQWCLMAFFGGLAFSRQFQMEGNLILIAGVHWVATYLNTPRPPIGKLSDR